MSDRINKLTDEVNTIDANEQREETEVAALHAQVAELKKELADAQDSGDNFAIQTATDKLHAVNARLSALLAADADATSGNTPQSSQGSQSPAPGPAPTTETRGTPELSDTTNTSATPTEITPIAVPGDTNDTTSLQVNIPAEDDDEKSTI